MLLQKISNRQNWYLKTYNLKLTSYAKLKKYFHTIINFDNSSVITNNGCSFIIQYKKSINFGKVCKRKAEKIEFALNEYSLYDKFLEVGKVISVSDGVARVSGLHKKKF